MDGRGLDGSLIERRRGLTLNYEGGNVSVEFGKTFFQLGLFLADTLKGLIVLRFHHESVESVNQGS